nr:UDP-2,3-diacylglucosamine diphosphatase [Paludisphaera mucosa]
MSDVHLREDRPERGRRLVQFVERLAPGDRLLIAGDLCDFWMGSRGTPEDLAKDETLRALIAFREAGGSLTILPGNHDLWLVPFYERTLGATILSEPALVESHGLRLHIVHGHLLGARRKWKAAMESREFFRSFGALPHTAARALDVVLEAKNRRGLAADEQRHLAVFREYADHLQDGADIVVFGHVHRAVDLPGRPRLVVLGGWQNRVSYLEIDAAGASFHIEGGSPEDGLASPFPVPPNRNDPSHASS